MLFNSCRKLIKKKKKIIGNFSNIQSYFQNVNLTQFFYVNSFNVSWKSIISKISYSIAIILQVHLNVFEPTIDDRREFFISFNFEKLCSQVAFVIIILYLQCYNYIRKCWLSHIDKYIWFLCRQYFFFSGAVVYLWDKIL